MGTTTPTPIDLDAPALLRLMWLASPALPVGGFSYSEGLEAAVESGIAGDEAGARVWLLDQLHLALGRCDLPVVKAAFAAWRNDDAEALRALNRWVLATRETGELALQTAQMGRSLAQWLQGQDGGDRRVETLRTLAPAPSWPIAQALALVRSGAPLRAALLAYAFGWAENAVQAALRAVPLGQNAGQRLLAALAEAIPAVVDEALRRPEEERQAHTPMLAIQSARHETQYSRLFRS